MYDESDHDAGSYEWQLKKNKCLSMSSQWYYIS